MSSISTDANFGIDSNEELRRQQQEAVRKQQEEQASQELQNSQQRQVSDTRQDLKQQRDLAQERSQDPKFGNQKISMDNAVAAAPGMTGGQTAATMSSWAGIGASLTSYADSARSLIGQTQNQAQRDAFGNLLANLPDSKSAGDLTKKVLEVQSDKNLSPDQRNAKLLSEISSHLEGIRQNSNDPAMKTLHQGLVADLISANIGDVAGKPKDFKTMVDILDRIPAGQQRQDAIQLALGLSREANPLAALKEAKGLAGLDSQQAKAAQESITKAAIGHIADLKDANKKLTPDEQAKIFSDRLASIIPGSDKNKVTAAMTQVLANLPDGASVKSLAEKVIPLISDNKLSPEQQNAKLLSEISRHFDGIETADRSTATRDLHRDLMANLMTANGLDYRVANVAAKVLDHIPADKRENAIRLAMSVAKEQDPIAALTGHYKDLAAKSGLSERASYDARRDITEAGVQLMSETAKQEGLTHLTRDKIIGLLSRGDQGLVGQDGNLDRRDFDRIADKLTQNILNNPITAQERAYNAEANWKREVTHQNTIRGGALVATGGLFARRIMSWQPGDRGLIRGMMNRSYYQTQGIANAGMVAGTKAEATSQLGQALSQEKMDQINDLAKLIQASGLESNKSGVDLRQRDLEGLATITRALDQDGNQMRLQNHRVLNNEKQGRFDMFTDNVTGREFYRFTGNGNSEFGRQTIFAIKGEDGKWHRLQGENYTFQDKDKPNYTYSHVVDSINERRKILQRDDLKDFYYTQSKQTVADNGRVTNYDLYRNDKGQELFRTQRDDGSYYYATRAEGEKAWKELKPTIPRVVAQQQRQRYYN